MTASYHIPAHPVRTQITVSKSRFLTTVEVAASVQQARQIIARVRAERPDASHHVYAFRVGFGNSVTEGMSDDGEPSGTSGPPTLAVLRGSDLGDIVLVTTRYFGGTKLGKGGLVRAYTQSAQTALNHLQTELKVEKKLIGLELSYPLYHIAKLAIAEHHGIIEDEVFDERILVIARFAAADVPAFCRSLRDKTSGQAAVVNLS